MGNNIWTAEHWSRDDRNEVALVRPGDGRDDPFADHGCTYIFDLPAAEALLSSLTAAVGAAQHQAAPASAKRVEYPHIDGSGRGMDDGDCIHCGVSGSLDGAECPVRLRKLIRRMERWQPYDEQGQPVTQAAYNALASRLATEGERMETIARLTRERDEAERRAFLAAADAVVAMAHKERALFGSGHAVDHRISVLVGAAGALREMAAEIDNEPTTDDPTQDPPGWSVCGKAIPGTERTVGSVTTAHGCMDEPGHDGPCRFDARADGGEVNDGE